MTFHRAIDMTRDIYKAAETVRDLGTGTVKPDL
jgi:copper homeostasis protein CutC